MVESGVKRELIKLHGRWRSDEVDAYLQPSLTTRLSARGCSAKGARLRSLGLGVGGVESEGSLRAERRRGSAQAGARGLNDRVAQFPPSHTSPSRQFPVTACR